MFDKYIAAAHWIVGFRIGLDACGKHHGVENLFDESRVDWEEFIDNHDTAMRLLDGDFVNIINRDYLLGFVNSIKRAVGISWGAEIQ